MRWQKSCPCCYHLQVEALSQTVAPVPFSGHRKHPGYRGACGASLHTRACGDLIVQYPGKLQNLGQDVEALPAKRMVMWPGGGNKKAWARPFLHVVGRQAGVPEPRSQLFWSLSSLGCSVVVSLSGTGLNSRGASPPCRQEFHSAVALTRGLSSGYDYGVSLTLSRQLDPGHVCILGKGDGWLYFVSRMAEILTMLPGLFSRQRLWWHCRFGSGAPVDQEDLCSSGYDVSLTRWRPPARSWPRVYFRGRGTDGLTGFSTVSA